jgi:predicted nucleotidyltransferase
MSQQQAESQPSANAPANGMSIDFEALRPQIEALCRKYGIAELSVFGSVARGDDRPDSDVDFLYVSDPERQTGWEFYDIIDELSELLGRKVDVVPKNYLHWVIRDRVLADARILYAA